MDTYGLADVTMRRVASTLGVQPGALYYHVESKQALFAAMSQVILADLPPFSGGHVVRLRLWAARLHSLLLAHHGGAELVSSVLALGDWESSPGASVQLGLLANGYTPRTASAAAHGLVNLVLGHAFDEEQRIAATRLGLAPQMPSWDSAEMLDDAVGLFVEGLLATGEAPMEPRA
jgi:AcrR family transcriptional regulator